MEGLGGAWRGFPNSLSRPPPLLSAQTIAAHALGSWLWNLNRGGGPPQHVVFFFFSWLTEGGLDLVVDVVEVA